VSSWTSISSKRACGVREQRRAIVEAGGRIAGVGFIIGVIAGCVGLLTGGSSAEMAKSAARVAWLLVPALPATLLWSMLKGSAEGRLLARGRTDIGTCALLVAVGTIAGLAGCGVFLVSATNIPVVLSDATAVEFRSQLTSHFGWSDALGVVAITFVVSVLLAFWTRGRHPS
jgi:hypothetical protein